METTNTNDEKLNGEKFNEELSYENDSYIGDLPTRPLVGNGLTTTNIVQARLAGKKWGHFVKKRRFTRQSSGNPADFVAVVSSFGLDEEVGIGKDDRNQIQLNRKLISHFVHLSRSNDNNDEVDLELIDELIKKGADVNCRDKHGQGLLHEAAREWHTDLVVFLVEHGADVNLTDKLKRTPLHVAAAVDYPEMVEMLIEKGADLEATTKDENQTPLHFAARNDATASLKILIKLGADIEAKDYKQRTPIFVAAELDRSETARFLIDMNADVTIVDTSGQMCMTHMITKMGPVARSALDQYHKKDRANRKQYFYLDLLAVPILEEGKKVSLAKTPLQVIVNYRQLDLIMHPVIMRLIDVKWNQFGRIVAIRTFLYNLLFVLIWTILGVSTPWFLRHIYIFPQDGWKVFLWVLGCLVTAYEIFVEIKEIISSRKKFRKWKMWREREIEHDMKFCHPKWPEERKYLEREKETLDDMLPTYFQDFWNYFDWVVYFSILLVVILHIADVSLVNREAPCCTLAEGCVNSSVLICEEGFVNNASLSVWSNRFFVVLIIFLWLRLMKFTRAFRFFGPFIVMLGKLSYDVLRFLYLYLEFYIPYSCAFWMIFGNITTIPSMRTVDQMMFSLFRITLVDDYEYQEMQTYDIVMAYILIGTFLGISAVLCLNLFIALLSDTFQRVYDNANANAVMQQAALLLSFEENLPKSRKKQVRRYLHKNCNPEVLYYDDDLTVVQDADLKKVTIQIKEQMDELMEYIHQEERDNRTSFDEFDHHDEKPLDNDDFKSPKGKIKSKSNLHIFDVLKTMKSTNLKGKEIDGAGDIMSGYANESMQKVSSRLTDFTTRLQRLQASQNTQEQSYKRLRDDVKDIKNMLATLMGGTSKSSEHETGFFSKPSTNLRLANEQLSSAPKPESRDSSKMSVLLKNIFGTPKSKLSANDNEVTPLPHFVPPSFRPPASNEKSSKAKDELISLGGSSSSRTGSAVPPTAAVVRAFSTDVTMKPPESSLRDSNV